MSEFNLLNETVEEQYTPSPEDFVLTQSQEKIHDKKFETKTTTFAKDAFKRFCKNRSSVVAAMIIGLLILLSIIIPWVSPHDIETPQPSHGELLPKLFETGTGFWDGTKIYKDQPYDVEKGEIVDKKMNAVVEIIDFKDGELTNSAHPTARGGYFKLTTKPLQNPVDNRYSKINFMINYDKFAINSTDNYKVQITLGHEDDIDGQKLGEYRIALYDGSTDIAKKYNIPYLVDWTWDHGQELGQDPETGEDIKLVHELSLSDYLAEYGIDDIKQGTIRIEIVQDVVQQYILIESIILSADGADEETQAQLAEISLTDANKQCLMGPDALTGAFPKGYWRATGNRALYGASKVLVTFRYDEYEAKLGFTKDEFIGGSIMNEYIAKGWCDYDYNEGPSSFVVKSDKCPIVSVKEQNYNAEKGVYTLTCDIIKYKYQGFDEMPKYLFGTTKAGEDVVTLSFKSLRTSLIVAFLASAVCLIFGLCWGAISGYFGGNVDLAMERFCEILGGVPYIVVMTLITLHFGSSIGIFALGLCITGWLGVAGRTRTQFYRFKGREYILASRTLGASDMRLIFKHILPNSLGTIVTGSVLMIPGVIFSEASLSYLKLGLQGVKSFGTLLANNQVYLKTLPALILFPASIISLLMISFNLFGNGLRDALNPSLKGGE